MVNVQVSDFVKAKLEAIKKAEEHKSLDSVIRVMLLEKEKAEEKKEESEK